MNKLIDAVLNLGNLVESRLVNKKHSKVYADESKFISEYYEQSMCNVQQKYLCMSNCNMNLSVIEQSHADLIER